MTSDNPAPNAAPEPDRPRSIEDWVAAVGETAVFLVSDMSRGITGEILHVDAGYHVVGMKVPTAPDITLDKVE